MNDDPLPQSEIILYQTEDGRTRIQCRFENETLSLTQAQIAELFQTTPQNVTLHLKSVFAEGELSEAATCKDYLQVRLESTRKFPAATSISPSAPRRGTECQVREVRQTRSGDLQATPRFDVHVNH